MKSKKITIIGILLIVAIVTTLVISSIGANNRESTKRMLVGRTVHGEHVYKGTYSSSRDYFQIHFIDENYCQVLHRYQHCGRWGDVERENFIKEDYVKYELSGTFDIKLNFLSSGAHAVEDYEISLYNGRMYLDTENYNSDVGLELSEGSTNIWPSSWGIN